MTNTPDEYWFILDNNIWIFVADPVRGVLNLDQLNERVNVFIHDRRLKPGTEFMVHIKDGSDYRPTPFKKIRVIERKADYEMIEFWNEFQK